MNLRDPFVDINLCRNSLSQYIVGLDKYLIRRKQSE